MKMLFVFLFMATTAFAQEPYKLKPVGFMPVCDISKIEIKNLPPIRDQGRYGLCYAHSSVLLLEHLRCANNPNPQACYANKGSVLHLSRYHNTISEELIKIGGDPGSILTRFSADRKLATESCAEYEDWKNLDKLYKDERRKLVFPEEDKSEIDFFYYISRQIKQNKATQEDLKCWANDMIHAGINQNLQDIMGILYKAKDLNWQELRYQLLVPKSCFREAIQYPEYSIHAFPSGRDVKSFKGFRDFVFKALSAGVPVEASFKSSRDGNHSATIVGQRHVCNQKSCELQFKIENSYGRSWQDINDNGWVNAENLVDLMSGPQLGVMAILPKGKTLPTSVTAPYYEKSPAKSTMTNSGNEKCWKVEEGIQEYIYADKPKTPSTPVTPSSSSGHQNTVEKGLWKCMKDGSYSFSDRPIDGADCKKIK